MPADDGQPDLDALLWPGSTEENQLLARLCHPSTVIAKQLLDKLGLTMWPQPADPFGEEPTWLVPPRSTP